MGKTVGSCPICQAQAYFVDGRCEPCSIRSGGELRKEADRRRLQIGVGAGLVVLASCAIIGGTMTDCSSTDTPKPQRQPLAAVIAPTMAAVVIPPPRPAPVRVATVELPGKGFDINHVLGAPRAGVDRLLGKFTVLDDGPILYENFDKVAVTVMFEFGKAALVTITANGFHDTEADRAAVLAWVHATADIDIDRTYANTPSPNFQIGMWLAGAQLRNERRREIAKWVDGFATKDAPGAHVHSSGTMLTLSAAPGDKSCARATLAMLRDAFKGGDYDLVAAGFDAIECDMIDVDVNPTLKLR